MKKDCWDVMVRDEFQQAMAEIEGRGISADDRVSFWELGFNLSEDILRVAAVSIHNEMASRTGMRHPKESCLVLFQLLRTRLTNVRGNHLWPEVGDGFSRLAGIVFDPGTTANYFRDAIRRVFNDRLEPVHNRYVMFCLDETGVGKDRSRIVADFLDRLLYRAGDEAWIDMDVEDGLARFYRGYLSSLPDKQDVEILETVLHRTGLALIRLVADLRESGDAFMVTLWGWGRIRDYWFERSGIDLDRLIPEGRWIFSEMLNRIGDFISRQGIARLAREVQKIDWPGGQWMKDTITDRDIPLAAIRVHHGGDAKIVAVTDEFGLTAEKVLQYESNVWHRIGRLGVFCWKEKPFGVRTGLARLEKAVPIMKGNSPETAFVRGFFWSGRLDYGTPVADGVKTPVAGTDLNLRYEWLADEKGLTFVLRGFSAAFVDYTGPATIMFDGTPFWSGDLEREGVAANTSASFRAAELPSGADTIGVALRADSGRVLAFTQVENPLAGKALVVFNGRIISGRKLVVNAWPVHGGIRVFVGTGGKAPEVKGSGLQKTGNTHDGYHDIYTLEPESGRTDVFIHAGGLSWRICRRAPVTMGVGAYGGCIVVSGVEVEGFNGLLPVTSVDPISITIMWLGDIPVRELAEWRMGISTDTAGYRWPLPALLHGSDPENDGTHQSATIHILSWLEDHGISLPDGLISLSMGSDTPGQQAALYRIGSIAMDDVSRVGSPAGLFLGGTGVNMRVESDQPVRAGDVLENKFVKATLPVAAGLKLIFSWQPRYEDACIFYRREYVPENKSLDIKMLQESTLRVFSDMEAGWEINLDGVAVAGNADLPLELANAAFGHETGPPPLKRILEAKCRGKLLRTWQLSTMPVDITVACEWQSPRKIGISATWYGLPDHRLEFRLTGEGVPVSTFVKSEKSTAGKPAAMEYSGTIGIISGMFQGADTLDIYCLGGKIGSIGLDRSDGTMDTFPGPEQIRDGIRRLFGRMTGDTDDDNRLLEQLVRLVELHLRETGELPFPIDALLVRVNRHGSPEVQNSVASILYLTDQLASPVAVPLGVPDVMDGGYLGIVWLTLRAALEAKLAGTGEARPSVLGELARALSEMAVTVEREAYAAWTTVISDFCRHQASILGGDAEAEPLQSDMKEREIAFYDPLVGFDENINSWLEQSRKRERGI